MALFGQLDASQFQHRRQHVGDVLVLAPEGTPVGEAGPPRDDQGHLVSTLMSVDLVEAKRRARGHGPTLRVVGQGLRATDQVQTFVVHLS